MISNIVELLYNLAVLVAFSTVSGAIRQRWNQKVPGILCQGLLFGAAAVIGMMRPLVLGPGLIFDGRSVMISLCGLFFGPIAASIAGGMALLVRVFLIGGVGVLMGGLVIVMSALVGVAFHEGWVRKGKSLTAGRLLIVGLLVHAFMVLLMFSLPANTSLWVVKYVGPPVLLAYPLATLLIGKLLSSQETAIRSAHTLLGSQKALDQQAAQLRTLIDTLPDLIWLKDPDGVYLACNARFELFFGAKEKDIVGKTDDDFVDRELAEQFRKHDLKAIEAGRPCANEERITFASDGHEEDLETIKTPVVGSHGEILGVLGIGRNITERKIREHELESTNRYYDMLSQVGQTLLKAQTRKELFQEICNIAVDRGGFQLAWIGWLDPETRQVVPVAKAGELLPYLDGIMIFANETLEGQGPSGISILENRPYVCQDFNKDSSTTPWRMGALASGIQGSASLPIHLDEQVVGAFGVYTRDPNAFRDRDIALLQEMTAHISFGLGHLAAAEKQKMLQMELHKAQKLESLGNLAGGIAHDMNNVLGAILGLASVHLESQPQGSPAYRAFNTISKAAIRGGEMVKKLLSFARQTPVEERDLDVNAILQDEVRLLERTTLSTVHVELDTAPDLHRIRGDESALNNVFMNICVNAVDAMSNKGTLILRTRNVDDDWIEVMVEDTGMGMPKEVLAKAMDPFFTTKEVGKGTGLGLSLVYSTVKAHHGQIDIQSEPGRGTRVRLRFPACEGAPLAVALPEQPASVPPQGTLNVLLVDDDELVQFSTRVTLEDLGHNVTVVSSGEEALARLESGYQPDVVFLDMNMPGLGGIGTLPRLRALRPALPVLLCTGRLDQAALDLASSLPNVTILPKPFSMRGLQQFLGGLGLG